MLLRKRVIKVLDCVRLQTFKRDIAERRPQIQLSLPFVEIRCGILDADLLVFQPNIKPFIHGHFTRLLVYSAVDLRGDCGELLPHLPLRFAIDGFLNLLSRSGINAEGIARLPASVRALADRAAALGPFCHSCCQCFLHFF